MSDPNETIADIVREIRAAAYIQNADTPESVIAFANRIEEAYNREHAEWHGETNAAKEARNRIACKMRYEFAAKCRACKAAPGNVAAMREALEKIRHEYGWGRIGCRTCVSSEADVERVSDLFEKQIDAALSAPQRNCDRFATEDEAREAYWAYREPLEFNNKPFVAITEWLFAPAEGETK